MLTRELESRRQIDFSCQEYVHVCFRKYNREVNIMRTPLHLAMVGTSDCESSPMEVRWYSWPIDENIVFCSNSVSTVDLI